MGRSFVASELPTAEIVRRLAHAVVDHHEGELQDDGTIVMVQWHPGQ
jgi:hypothetical protein